MTRVSKSEDIQGHRKQQTTNGETRRFQERHQQNSWERCTSSGPMSCLYDLSLLLPPIVLGLISITFSLQSAALLSDAVLPIIGVQTSNFLSPLQKTTTISFGRGRDRPFLSFFNKKNKNKNKKKEGRTFPLFGDRIIVNRECGAARAACPAQPTAHFVRFKYKSGEKWRRRKRLCLSAYTSFS